MNREFYENVIAELTVVCDELERLALEESRTALWRLHQKTQETLRSIKFYFKEEYYDEPIHESM